MQGLMLENIHFVKGLDPVADALAGTKRSDVVNLSKVKKCAWLIHKGVGATGTAQITVEASDDAVPTNVAAVPFKYREITSTDIQGAIKDAAAAGFALTAGSSQLYVAEIDVDALLASGYKFASLKSVEVVDDAVVAGIICMLGDLRYGVDDAETFLT